MNRNKIISSMMCAGTIMTSVLPVFATQTLTNETLNQKEDTEVLYSKSAAYMVTIPKQITLGSDKTSTYSVKVEGDIPSDREVYVAPVDTISETDGINFYMEDQSTTALKKDNVTATVTPTKTVWNFEDVASATEVTDNSIEAKDLTSGSWKGVFNFDINLKTMGEEAVALEAGLYDANGVMLCSWEESGIDVEKDFNGNPYSPSEDMGCYVINNTYPTTTTVVLPNTITKIGKFAFQNCTSLTNITIPSSVTFINTNAFSNCINAFEGELDLSNVTTLGTQAFSGCTKIESVILSDNLSDLGSAGPAFYGCSNLSKVIYKGETYTSYTILNAKLKENGVTFSPVSTENPFANTALTK